MREAALTQRSRTITPKTKKATMKPNNVKTISSQEKAPVPGGTITGLLLLSLSRDSMGSEPIVPLY